MNQLIIHDFGKEENFIHLTVEKNESFFELFSKLLLNVFDIKTPKAREDGYLDENDDWITKKLSINDYTDKRELFGNKNVRIELFYGNKKIFLLFYSLKPDWTKLIKYVEANSTWKKANN